MLERKIGENGMIPIAIQTCPTVYRSCTVPLELEWPPRFTDFFRIPSLFLPSLWARVSGVLLQKPSFRKVSKDQPSMLNLLTHNIIVL